MHLQQAALLILYILSIVEYTCKASNAGGTVTASARLTVRTVPVFIERPLAKTVGRGSLVTFRCVASGFPQPVISWSRVSVGCVC